MTFSPVRGKKKKRIQGSIYSFIHILKQHSTSVMFLFLKCFVSLMPDKTEHKPSIMLHFVLVKRPNIFIISGMNRMFFSMDETFILSVMDSFFPPLFHIIEHSAWVSLGAYVKRSWRHLCKIFDWQTSSQHPFDCRKIGLADVL